MAKRIASQLGSAAARPLPSACDVPQRQLRRRATRNLSTDFDTIGNGWRCLPVPPARSGRHSAIDFDSLIHKGFSSGTTSGTVHFDRFRQIPTQSIMACGLPVPQAAFVVSSLQISTDFYTTAVFLGQWPSSLRRFSIHLATSRQWTAACRCLPPAPAVTLRQISTHSYRTAMFFALQHAQHHPARRFSTDFDTADNGFGFAGPPAPLPPSLRNKSRQISTQQRVFLRRTQHNQPTRRFSTDFDTIRQWLRVRRYLQPRSTVGSRQIPTHFFTTAVFLAPQHIKHSPTRQISTQPTMGLGFAGASSSLPPSVRDKFRQISTQPAVFFAEPLRAPHSTHSPHGRQVPLSGELPHFSYRCSTESR
jgi:hypothetical protein